MTGPTFEALSNHPPIPPTPCAWCGVPVELLAADRTVAGGNVYCSERCAESVVFRDRVAKIVRRAELLGDHPNDVAEQVLGALKEWIGSK